MRTIQVTGSGRMKLRPDTTRLTLTLSGVEPEYDAALSASADGTKALGAALEPVGIAPGELKTQTFHITTEYEGYEENGRWKQRFLGYRYLHVLVVDFDADNQLLGRILGALAECPANAELQIAYTVRDPERAKTALLAAAVADAGTKARALAEAAGVTLKTLQSIDYSRGEQRFAVPTMDALARPTAKANFELDIVPEDIDVSDTVTIVWEIG